MSVHYEVELPALPGRVYDSLTRSDEFAAATGAPAEIGAGEGEVFSVFGGRILGRHIELVPGQRIVQAWRMADWDAGVYSLVRLTLTEKHGGTTLVLDHDGYPEGKSPMYPSWHEHVSAGWPLFYFEPLTKSLAA